MGEYFRVVCHTCKTRLANKIPLKVMEIRLNPSACELVGLFVSHHPGHEVELRGDEYNYRWDKENCETYHKEFLSMDDPDQNGIGVSELPTPEGTGKC